MKHALIAMTLAGLGIAARAEEPTLKDLLAALPPDTEQILAWDLRASLAPDSAVLTETRAHLDQMVNWSKDKRLPGLQFMVEGAVAAADPHHRIVSAVEFEDDGPHHLRGVEGRIYTTGEPLTDLRTKLSRLADEGQDDPDPMRVLRAEKEGLEMFRGPSAGYAESRPLFIAFHDDRTVITANREQHLLKIAARLKRQDVELSPRWRELESVVASAPPLLLVRVVDPDSSDNWVLRAPLPADAVADHLLCVWISDLNAPSLSVRLRSSRPDFRDVVRNRFGPLLDPRLDGDVLESVAPLSKREDRETKDLMLLFGYFSAGR